MHPFVNEADAVAVLLAPAEREVLRAVPILLRNSAADDGDPAWACLLYTSDAADESSSV